MSIPPPTPKKDEKIPTKIPVTINPRNIIDLKFSEPFSRCTVATCLFIVKIDLKKDK